MPTLDFQMLEYWLVDAMAIGWYGLQFMILSIALIILVSSLDDLFIDAAYWFLKLKRRGQGNSYNLPDTAEELAAKPERPLAIMVPAWDESSVIARMIANTINNMKYENFHIFVGTYPNDIDTQNEVDRMSALYPNVTRVNVGHPGPTSKADCLNWLVQGIFAYEAEANMQFAGIVMHDAEDVIHPYSFSVVNWVLPYLDFMQLPVYSMPRRSNQWVASHYMDEFAEWHSKDMIVREALTGTVPSAGVATAFSRHALSELARTNENLPFNTDSLTEDYDVGQRIEELGLRGGFVRHTLDVRVQDENGDWTRERQVVSTREFFPDKFKYSVRQKSRWILGIAYVGWEQLGWPGSLGNKYYLWRDRKGILTSTIAPLAYFIVINILSYLAFAALAPTSWHLPTLIEAGSPAWYVAMVNLAFLTSRVGHRMYFVGLLHGWRAALLSPIRIVVSNFIAFFANMRAARQYIVSRVTGKRLTWDKTSHAYPSASELMNTRARLGEVLTQMGAVRPADVDAALSAQHETYRPLGMLLLDNHLVSDEAMSQAFGELAGYRSVPFGVHEVEDDVIDMMPQRIMARFGAFPIRIEEGKLIVGLREPLPKPKRDELSELLNTSLKVEFVLSPRSDVTFAIRFAYDGHLIDSTIADIALLERVGIANAEDVDRIWKGIRRSYTPFADLAVRMGFLTHTEMVELLDDFWQRSDTPFMGDYLIELGYLSEENVNEILDTQALELSDALTIAAQLGLITEEDKVQLEQERERTQ